MKWMRKTSLILLPLLMLSTLKILASPSTTYYVSSNGNDGFDCLSPATACSSINGAINKAASGDTILVTAEPYTGTGAQVVLVDKDINLSGGWNNDFSNPVGRTIIDGENTRIGVWIAENISASIDNFTIQDGYSDASAGGITNYYGTLVLTNSIVENSVGSYEAGGGITNYGVLTVRWSTIRNNDGGGVNSWQQTGPVLIENSTINNNTHGTGVVINRQNASIVNSTISGNQNTLNPYQSGGGIYFNGVTGESLQLRNVTVTGNETSENGGGIFMLDLYGGEVLISNSIIAGNAATIGSDCFGIYSSQGYNLIGDTLDCTINSASGDQLNVNPRLGPLQDNGGPTHTHWIYANSTAIDSGNPGGCLDQLGAPLTIDQRGFTRPMDGNNDGDNICDIGAYEVDPENPPPPSPGSYLYVTPDGNDTNDCLSSTAPCQTISGAVSKSVSGDEILISIGTFTKNDGAEVVLIDHYLTLSGGWNLTFDQQTGYSTIDGQNARRGITITDDVWVWLEKLILQHGFSLEIDGGGLYAGYRSRITIDDSIISDNLVGNTDPFYFVSTNGGGIGMGNAARLTLNDSKVLRNSASSYGGGIFSGESTVMINNSMISYNQAGLGGGLSNKNGGYIEMTDSTVSDNTSVNWGGGINSQDAQLVLKNCAILRNTAGGAGGGITGHMMTIDHSSINGNFGHFGGGIHALWDSIITNSSIVRNTSIGNGGGIFSQHDLTLINSTIAYNVAFDPNLNEADGGGIYWRGNNPLQVSNVTIVKNYSERDGGGINAGFNQVSLRNSLVSDNTAGSGPDCVGNIQSNGYNLLGDPMGCNFIPSTGDLLDIDAMIYLPFGIPKVITVLADSPAIDGGNPQGCVDHQGNPILNDQLGMDRPIDGDEDNIAICDIGAYEYNPLFPPRWSFLSTLYK